MFRQVGLDLGGKVNDGVEVQNLVRVGEATFP